MAEVRVPARPERFRILIIGRGNAGKTTILRAVCGVNEEPEVYDGEGNKIMPVVHLEEDPKVDHVEEAVSEIPVGDPPEEAMPAVPKLHRPEEVISIEASEAHHPVGIQANQVIPVSNRSTLRSAWRSVCARLMCRAPNSILAAHLEELNSAMSSPRKATDSILVAHPGEPAGPVELNLVPSLAPRREPKSILSPTALRGKHHIDYELIFPSNPGFVFHDSCGFESGAVEELEWVREFIQDRASSGSMSKQLHAIWYCFPADSNRLMTAAEKEFFNKIDTGSVPVIAIVTKFDALDAAACTSLCEQGVPFMSESCRSAQVRRGPRGGEGKLASPDARRRTSDFRSRRTDTGGLGVAARPSRWGRRRDTNSAALQRRQLVYIHEAV
ncbi:hypothetical protein BOTBODRAFT_31144 [Botryobasidium botryosum FD-172 SS1]|uniref:G domain-containing protein n=1 Tax=Botryobasidium botryosum (strain FD-172 SS1) TaxID=930990 RepID=A0A067MJV2_BOTB1|nr:hypothetical protein BOTBODRAFT_31144 [Botryobasidium botryosum FD-172 SS1]